mmetsp:Transcript_15044/g.47421  ORF Transcript_15044/g.47421 Transcript_15044/m.47421 type:complete len:211 (-) Transcript_15044:351-983(-)
MTVNNEDDYDFLYKVVLVGDATVGKTHLLSRYIKGTLPKAPTATIGVEFATRTVPLAVGGTVKAQIWDTAGQERFRSLAPMYYRGASSAVVVYDQTNPVTFDRAQEWVRQVMQTSTNPNIVIALAANKADLVDQRQVEIDKAQAFADREGLLLMETSAMTGKNVARLFDVIAEHLPDEPFVPEQRGLVISQAAAAAGSSASRPSQRSGCC